MTIPGASEPVAVLEAFDQLVAALDPPMVIVTTAVDGERSGCLVGFHTQCSIDPRRYSVWLSKANHTYRLATRVEPFVDLVAVHLLAADQHDLADLFGHETGDQIDKFARCGWSAGPGGVPLLDACPTRLIGRPVTLTEAGADHACLVLDPIDVVPPDASAPPRWLRLSDAGDIHAGHPPDDFR